MERYIIINAAPVQLMQTSLCFVFVSSRLKDWLDIYCMCLSFCFHFASIELNLNGAKCIFNM